MRLGINAASVKVLVVTSALLWIVQGQLLLADTAGENHFCIAYFC